MRGIRLTKKNTSLIFTLLILLVSAIYQSLQSKTQNVAKQTSVIPTLLASQSAELVRVAKVIDGDTIELDNGQKVRYIGIDTPELHHPKKKLQCFGKEARDKNKELVEGKLVRMEKDISETDRYWRLLRYVYLPTDASPSGIFVNDYLVREGFAHASTFPPDVKYSDYLKNLESQARENIRGLWNKCE
ncbi:hypothetical protein A2954_06010 [Candidatus Roizmanbacteria bacterium RIFCSPLOWO2_01_FULL_37_12]|uniref:TNase-like domain-containing protein n=1 Tax=Candidatus Roizmanbacteria bacterium RIFCSPLOWO2_01_FULL_37_12 TaxID=1802056 RepID=A0A1F7ICH7_9BACT|nr:MAG: hypothetical protein A2768_01175 [Candidatus Roizmanbacteria bacterium RIFCSPHIGHO2_01_FULL_37_16]OGK26048.1 MAG: hypothetical protein A3D76_00340 [Candidatus Roizmanbacteria bacterium RIFCSPHIGHO2_02_FULL_37_9b]OGK41059.1 MAG: hypothetical protein A2954_06010 [Candidatus Roizmanbacteria bacterium RIFCSPLOWO2_01_FULL_37_12]